MSSSAIRHAGPMSRLFPERPPIALGAFSRALIPFNRGSSAKFYHALDFTGPRVATGRDSRQALRWE
jgi:hypothetical protein